MNTPIRSANAFTDDVLGTHDAVSLVSMMESGDLSATEVAEATIRRAESVEPSINAIVCATFERGLEAAAKGPAGPLGGLPMFIKDMSPIEGLVTTYGSDSMIDSAPAKATAPFAQMFDALGTVLLGTSTMPEYGLTCNTEFIGAPPTRNPWNLEHSCGGSSGGAGALVAAGVVPMATSADGGGSTRVPAGVNGLVGLKPTRERLLGGVGDNVAPVNITTYGVVTRSVRDTCAFYAAAEMHHHNPQLPPIGLVEHPIARRLRIGLVGSSPTITELDAPTKRVLESTGALLESLGHRVEPIDVPVDERFPDDFILYWSFAALVIQLAGKKVIHRDFDPKRLTPFVKGLVHNAKRNLVKVPGAIRRLRRSNIETARRMGCFDVVLTPTTAHLTPLLGHLGLDLSFETHMGRMKSFAAFTPVANATGFPAISLPLGHDDEHNLPIGMHFMARSGQERLLLELALELEAAQPFRMQSANVPSPGNKGDQS